MWSVSVCSPRRAILLPLSHQETRTLPAGGAEPQGRRKQRVTCGHAALPAGLRERWGMWGHVPQPVGEGGGPQCCQSCKAWRGVCQVCVCVCQVWVSKKAKRWCLCVRLRFLWCNRHLSQCGLRMCGNYSDFYPAKQTAFRHKNNWIIQTIRSNIPFQSHIWKNDQKPAKTMEMHSKQTASLKRQSPEYNQI